MGRRLTACVGVHLLLNGWMQRAGQSRLWWQWNKRIERLQRIQWVQRLQRIQWVQRLQRVTRRFWRVRWWGRIELRRAAGAVLYAVASAAGVDAQGSRPHKIGVALHGLLDLIVDIKCAGLKKAMRVERGRLSA